MSAIKISSALQNNSSLSVVESIMTRREVNQRIQHSAKQIIKRGNKEISRQGVKADGDTSKVMNTTRTCITPLVMEITAQAAASAYRGSENAAAKRAEKIDFSRINREAQKQGISLDTYENINPGEKTILLKGGRTEEKTFINASSFTSTVKSPETLYQTTIKEHGEKTLSSSNTSIYLDGIKENVKEETKHFISGEINQHHDKLFYDKKELSEEAKTKANEIREKTREYIKSKDFDALVINKLNSIVNDASLNYRYNGISSAKVDFEIQKNAATEIKDAILNNREVNINKVLGRSQMVMKNVNLDPRALSNFYSDLNKRIKSAGGKFDKTLEAQVRLTKRASALSDTYTKLHTPKYLMRSGFRILTKPLQQSETIKGMELTRSMGMGIKSFASIAFNPAMNIAYNASIFARKRAQEKAFAKFLGIEKKAARRAIRAGSKDFMKFLEKTGRKQLKYVRIKDFLKNPIINGIKRNIRQYKAKTMLNWASDLMGSSNPFVSWAGERLKNKGTYIMKDMGKGWLKASNKLVNKALNKAMQQRIEKFMGNAIGKPAGKLAAKASSKLGGTVLGKAFGFLGKTVGGTLKGTVTTIKTVSAVFKSAFTALKGVFDAIASAISTVMSYVAWALLIALGIFLGFFLVLQITFLTLEQLNDYYNYIDRFLAFFEDGFFDTKEEVFIEALEECHDEREAELIEIAESYEVGDIQYPSGENENLKEMYSAMAIMCQYDFDLFDEDEIKEIAEHIYNKTHKTTWEEYEYYDDDGGKHTAVHVYLDILRGDAMTYEVVASNWWVNAGEVGSTAYNGAAAAIATTAVNNDWMNVVVSTKAAIALNARCVNGVYYNLSAPIYTTINVNGNDLRVRQDCSGYVSACLNIYGSLSGILTSSEITDAESIPGFERLSWNGWENLNPGDIIAYHGHTEIFAYSSGGYHYVYSDGNSNAVRSSSVSTDSRNYVTVWRPYEPGSSWEVAAGQETDTAESEDYTFKDTYSGLLGVHYDPLFSNTSGMEFNEDTLNVDGYEDVLVANINAELEKTDSYFNEDTVLDGWAYKAHIPESASAESPWDFVRYIFAMQGVHVEMDLEKMDVLGIPETFDTDVLKPGDVIVYAPHLYRLDLLEKDLAFHDKTIKSVPDSAASIVADENFDAESFFVGYGGDWSVINSEVCTSKKTFDEKLNANQYTITTGEDGTTLPLNSSTSIREMMYMYCVPLIYIGNGQAVAYSYDLTDNPYCTNSIPPTVYGNSSEAKIRTYNLSNLDENRVYRINRYQGFTTKPIFGSTTYFEGWTDWNIACFMELINDECWDSAEQVKDISLKENNRPSWNIKEGDMDGEEKLYQDSLDFSWYDPLKPMFEGNDYHVQDSHYETYMTELRKVLIEYYDAYGILPSVGCSSSATLTHYRATEESLLYYNLWEIKEDSNHERAGQAEIYDYAFEGNVTVTTEDFRKFDTFYNAYYYWASTVTLDYGLSPSTLFTYDNFYDQLDAMTRYGIFTDETESSIKNIYTDIINGILDPSVTTEAKYVKICDLNEADEDAIRRKELMDDMTIIHDELVNTDWSVTRRSETPVIGKDGESQDHKNAIHLQELLEQYKEDFTEVEEIRMKYDLDFTDNYQTVYDNYKNDFVRYEVEVLEKMIEYRQNFKERFVLYYECKGHPGIGYKEGIDNAGIPYKKKIDIITYCTDSHIMDSPCGHCDTFYEDWSDVHAVSVE